MDKFKILFVAANPSRNLQLDDLRLDEEFREITAKLRASEHRDAYELVPCLAVRPDDLRSALLQHEPDILHFSGHGTPSDGLVLLDEDSQPYPVSQSALADLLRTIKGRLRLIVLNACYTQPLVEELAGGIDCAIGVSKALGDEAAISFSAAFYEALGYAKSVQTSFDLGLNSLSMEGVIKDRTSGEPHRKLILPNRRESGPDIGGHFPQLITRDGVDAADTYFVRPRLSFEEITRHARKRIAEEASKWLKQECDPFIMPALARRITRPEAMMSRHDTEPWETIGEDDARNLVLGQLAQDQNRVRIFSESGTGKTTLLHYCEQQIAASDDGRVPVRVTALSSFDWKGDVPITLVNGLLHAFLPTDTKEAERISWLKQLIRDHRVVFLFDAVDQTSDELAGLSLFLQSADVCKCPAILTGRPEVEQTQASVFGETNWDTYRVEPLDEPRIREYLGELSDKLLPVQDEAWKDTASYERKKQWSDLLQVPLLLRLMRRLAADDAEPSTQSSLTTLHNRHAVYRKAVPHLVDQGLKKLSKTSHRSLRHEGEVNEHLSEIAWEMVSRDNFTGIFQGESFRKWRTQHRDVLPALEQLDLTTCRSLLDNPDEFGLAWRHLSFCEYFAGRRFARLDRTDRERVVREHGRKPSWQWVFRFALSELAAKKSREECNALARDLIRFGNPFLVYDAIRGDGLTLDEQLDSLCRWLVHREWSLQGDYREAIELNTQRPNVDKEVLNILETLFDRTFRDSRCLHSAWELLTSSPELRATAIQMRYLKECREVAASSEPDRAVARSLSLNEHFIQCPPVGQKDRTFYIGENAERAAKINPFYLGRAPITNLQFELFDPSHKQWRDQYSPDDNSPALHVNWYMAVMFCTWLGEEYRLPTEDEWEIACRAGTSTNYWWGDEFNGERCNSVESKLGRPMPANPAHANEWGFMEMSGNVWEWCQEEFNPGSSQRVLRGGSWDYYARYCDCCFRLDLHPYTHLNNVGFRVAKTCT